MIPQKGSFSALAGLVLLYALLSSGCSRNTGSVADLRRFPLDSLKDLLTTSGVLLDREHSTDGNGSLRIDATDSTVVRLFELTDLDVDDARLIYRAKIRTENVAGQVFLEMWCRFPGRGEFFSRGLHSPLTGTTEWTTEETVFFLKKGEKPDLVKLNLVINGAGTVWIDDVRLLKGPLS